MKRRVLGAASTISKETLATSMRQITQSLHQKYTDNGVVIISGLIIAWTLFSAIYVGNVLMIM